MSRDQDQFPEDGVWDPEGFAAAETGGRKFRLLPHLGRGLAAAAIFVGLCVVFGGDEPQRDSDNKERVSLSGDFGLVGSINFASDGQTLLSSSWDKTVRIWEVGAWPGAFGEELARLPSVAEIYDAAMSPDCRTVATAGVEGVLLWNWRDERSAAEVVADLGASRALAFTPDGRSLAVGGPGGEVRLLDLRTRRAKLLFDERGESIRRLWITPDGSLLIALGYNGGLRFWDWRRERLVEKIDGSAETVLAASLSPDGKTLALSRYWNTPGDIEIWDLETGRLKARCAGHEGIVHALAFSRDGGTLASAGSDLRLRFWNSATGDNTGQIEDVGGWVRVLKFSADGRWLAYAGARDRVELKRVDLPEPPTRAVTAPPPPKADQDARDA